MAQDAQTFRRWQRLVFWLEECIPIPLTKWRLGLDGLIGLVPVAGDVLMLLVSFALIFKAWRVQGGRQIIGKMLKNILLDVLIGLIPIIGDIADIHWKANKKNLALLLEHHKNG